MKKKILVSILSLLLLFPAAVLGAVPATLEAPSDLTVELKHLDSGEPYFFMTCKIPRSILDIDSERPNEGAMYIEFDRKIDNGEWSSAGFQGLEWMTINNQYGELLDTPRDEGGLNTIDIKNHTYSYRMRFVYSYVADNGNFAELRSPDSNTFTLGSGSYFTELDTGRLSGQSRIETAVAIAQEGWPTGAETIILTRDDNYPDALTGTPLSKKLDAPLLFTNTRTLTPATAAEITRLKPNKIVILGGAGAVSQEIENGLKANYQVQRIGGVDRYDTAAKIAAELGYKGKVVIATGEDFHDALVAAPLAAYKGMPMLLAAKNKLPDFTLKALETIDPTETIVVGKSDAVDDSVLAALTNAKRYNGSDYYETATVVAEKFGADAGKIFFATGKAFADALSGSALAAKYNSPILYVNDPLALSVKQYLEKNKDSTKAYRLLGGEGAIPSNVVNAINQVYEDE
ncbi:MAG: cell wall-binding repeat-containing protein [Peptococcaceae bacterium]|nr:cell wall-binding repeat-containing protein [Peptococcaceae bacterium]